MNNREKVTTQKGNNVDCRRKGIRKIQLCLRQKWIHRYRRSIVSLLEMYFISKVKLSYQTLSMYFISQITSCHTPIWSRQVSSKFWYSHNDLELIVLGVVWVIFFLDRVIYQTTSKLINLLYGN